MESLSYSRSVSREEILRIFQDFASFDKPLPILKGSQSEVYGVTYPPIKDCLEKEEESINFILIFGWVENEAQLEIYGENLKEESLPEKISNFIKKYFKK